MGNELDQNKADFLSSTAKSILGAVPFAGPLLSELVGNLIPNQRIDRLSKYVVELDNKLSDLSTEKLRNLLRNDECIDLFEEGFVQASRALTDERRAQIASVVRNGLDENLITYSESKYVLKLLQELNDQEIIWLRFYLFPTMGGDEEYRNKHRNVLDPIPVTLGTTDEKIIKKAALQNSYREHLERIGLIRSHYRLDRNTKIPEFDKFTGKPSVAYRDLTALGRLVLKQIDLIEDNKNG
ncbi:hypothetical protein [Desulfobacula toluolica]|uniref:Conserved uncharacterized protein n=1 Tax=Desulfobacula toluolica (strain DSM 7467 / Tol2) TaxID=651182 RepID=K0NJX5_DESTT|nr:hypothetical protein [Desulfobacula toluolica]CCK81145.1 conserved uncharacterized protein [Desulfobacula toluolica Tol2]